MQKSDMNVLMARANKCRYRPGNADTIPAGLVRGLLCLAPMLLSPILTLDPQKVDRDLAFVMDCLSEVLEESREHALARQLPWSREDGAGRAAGQKEPPCEAQRGGVCRAGCDFA